MAEKSPAAPPEQLNAEAERLWRLGHELAAEDYIVVPADAGKSFLLGEVTGGYRHETRGAETFHVWGVHWLKSDISAQSIPELAAYFEHGTLMEIRDEQVCLRLKQHIPSLRKRAPLVFQWISIILLVSELIYFWPR